MNRRPLDLLPTVGFLISLAIALLEVVGQKIKLANRGQPCVAGPGFALPPPADAVGFTVVVDFVCAEPVSQLTVHDDLFDVLGADYHTLAKIEWPGGVQQFAFQPDRRETGVTVVMTVESGCRKLLPTRHRTHPHRLRSSAVLAGAQPDNLEIELELSYEFSVIIIARRHSSSRSGPLQGSRPFLFFNPVAQQWLLRSRECAKTNQRRR